MAECCGNHGNGEVSDGIVHPPPSFPRRRESSLVGTETYRKKQFLQPCVLDSRFCGNDEFRFLFLVFCPCGNDEILSFRNLSEKTETAPPSFPHRRESRPSGSGNIQRLSESLEVLDSRFHGNDERLRESWEWRSFRRHRPPSAVIPAQAGIRLVRFRFFLRFRATSKPSFPRRRESRP